ncbi:DUF3857 domain-containing protein [Mucilaginibacter myungsuensis]|uniref:DUF3857 domain-containing protein n=1 Tax=Mucilaginibacter myungsuensis TaxID=649104 RepID=A0A929PVN5_9SPHI|nr:DUF3857 domain-containing protein [Mucilaginibacter myungsuensis]MBE9660500.1 DUF3857 domain-containing protein [Mucilaginibacter myungsuensis]MDN3600544.1 DUF3857 domain-containing protein [Mucilaginibacter myungsuensis]
MKLWLLFLSFGALPFGVFAQNLKFGEVAADEMSMKMYAKDSSAHAVVLNEFGKTWLSSADHTPLIHEYYVKIKLFDTEAFKYGTIEIPLYREDNDRFETVTDIKAITYYRDENNQLHTAELDKKSIFRVNENKHWDVLKFTLPNLRPGCVIEYQYTMETFRLWNFKEWRFQWNIPKVYSEYEAHIPAFYNYNVQLVGPYKLDKSPAVLERDCFMPGYGVKCDCSKINYVMTNIPAFVEEEYMTSPKNFMSAVYYELSDYYDFGTGKNIKVAKEWKDVDLDVKRDQYFGGQIKRSPVPKAVLDGLIAGKTDEMEKAKAIYKFIQNSFKWNNFIGWRSEKVKTAFEAHTGSVADINLSLIGTLNAAGIKTDAVLLSTRDHGMVNKLFPVETGFNYVVATTKIGDKTYMLDATDPLLPFGLLPLECINDQGRVVSLDKPSYWVDMVAAEKKGRTIMFDVTLQENGKFKGTMVNYSLGYEALDKRHAMRRYNTMDEYVEELDDRLKKVKIKKFDIKNLDTLDAPLIESYEVEMDGYPDLSAVKYSFNAYFINRVNENPFKLEERNYPVDRGAIYDDRFVLNLHLPANMEIESLPENVALAMPVQGGRFMVDYNKTADGLSFSHRTQFNRSVYSTSEYPYLKEMFNKIIQAQSGEIVFKKK